MIEYYAIGGYYNSPSFKEAVLTTAFIFEGDAYGEVKSCML